MKITLATILSVFTMATLALTPAMAEDDQDPEAPETQKHWSLEAAEQQTAKLVEAVPSVNEEQKAKITVLHTDRNLALGAANQLEKGGADGAEVEAKRTEAWSSFKRTLKTILTEEQFAKYEAAFGGEQ